MHPDQDMVFNLTAMYAGAVADGHIIADDAGIVISDVQADKILDIAAFSDGNIIHVAPRHDAGPEAGFFRDADIAVQMDAGSDERIIVDLRRDSLKL